MDRRVKVIMGLACAAVFTLATATTSTANLLTDPGAELQTTAPNPNPTALPGWSLFNGAAFDNTVSQSGSWSIVLAGGGWSVPGAYQSFPTTPGAVWTFSGFGLVPTVLATAPANNPPFPWVGLQISFFGAGNSGDLGTVETGGAGAYATPASKIEVGEPANVWTPLTVTATAPAGAQFVQLFVIALNANGSPADTAYFDNLSAIPEPSSIGLALTGLLGLAAFVWKRRS